MKNTILNTRCIIHLGSQEVNIMAVNLGKLEQVMNVMDKINQLTVKGLLTQQERDTLLPVMKNEVLEVLEEPAKKEEQESKEKSKPKS